MHEDRWSEAVLGLEVGDGSLEIGGLKQFRSV